MTRRWCPSAAARPMVKRLPHGFFLLVVLSKCRPESGHQGPTAAADSGGPCAGCSGSRDRKLCGASAQHREAPPVQEAPPTEDQGTAPPPAPWLCAQFLLCGASRCPAARRPVCAQERGSPAGKTDCVPPCVGAGAAPEEVAGGGASAGAPEEWVSRGSTPELSHEVGVMPKAVPAR